LFTLTLDNSIIPKSCTIFDILVTHEARTDNSHSIDHINNTMGYTKDNSNTVRWRANLFNKDVTVCGLQQLAKFYTILEENKNE